MKKHADIAFTGERVVPGMVEPQLWNEHISRYRYAQLFANKARVLDIGCGTGYGTDLLAESASQVVGVDVSIEALGYASEHYKRPIFIPGEATAIPFQSEFFDLVTAFEVIEHLAEWEVCLSECARVLSRDGVFLVSTPNTEYYAEARGPSGPNPYHAHEFALEEFERALKRVFSCVKILAQNQQETITFSGDWYQTEAVTSIPPSNDLSDSHFFIGVCSFRPVSIPFYADISSTHNLLREREKHIRGLQGELAAARREYSNLLEFSAPALNGHGHVASSLRAASAEMDPRKQEIEALRARLEGFHQEKRLIMQSAWLRLGRLLGVGPASDYRERLRAMRASLKERLQNRLDALWAPAAEPVRGIGWFLASIPVVGSAAMLLAAVDVSFSIFGKRRLPHDTVCSSKRVSIVIPNWNGIDLLQANVPSVLAALAQLPGSEALVVDNGSMDGSAEFIRAYFPEIRLVTLPVNEGFAAACNLGAKAARNDIVVFLNNDMKVDDAFLAGLVKHFSDPLLFAVSSQIFFADPRRVREETGLTETSWEGGELRVGHRVDPEIRVAFPCSYPGGGSSAFHRIKFMQLGGFSELFHPFYYEDTDLGYLAWKRGWKVLYEPSSVVYHQHRGTISKVYNTAFIDSVIRRNSILFCWKNIHDWGDLGSHWRACLTNSVPNFSLQPAGGNVLFVRDLLKAYRKLIPAAKSRWQAHTTRKVPDKEAMLRTKAGYYRDRFIAPASPPTGRLNILFVSPYPIEPPMHGGALFMRDAIVALQRYANVHVVSFVDNEEQLSSQKALLSRCSSAKFLVRKHCNIDKVWTLRPAAVREFHSREFEWALQRATFLHNIDAVQLEYTIMGQYAGDYRTIPCMLFEHDVSVQSLWRRISAGARSRPLLLEYARMRLYEPALLERMARVQVCSRDNARYLAELRSGLITRVDDDLRACIDVQSYEFIMDGRRPDSLLFLGGFNHFPNVEGLNWFVREVFPSILQRRASVVLYVVGSCPPKEPPAWLVHSNIQLIGSVPDVKPSLQRYCVFVCPILVGSGVRVKLLEAFAAGIPAVATSVGAEGLTNEEPVCEVADSAAEFSEAVIGLLEDENRRRAHAKKARQFVERQKDSRKAAVRLEATYRREVEMARGALKRSA